MATHTPHKEQCRDCKCPVDEHLFNNDVAEYCRCCCHYYCDCVICLPTKNICNEDPEICHACDCKPIEQCDCSCHSPRIKELQEQVRDWKHNEAKKRIAEWIMRAN